MAQLNSPSTTTTTPPKNSRLVQFLSLLYAGTLFLAAGVLIYSLLTPRDARLFLDLLALLLCVPAMFAVLAIALVAASLVGWIVIIVVVIWKTVKRKLYGDGDKRGWGEVFVDEWTLDWSRFEEEWEEARLERQRRGSETETTRPGGEV